MSDNNNNNKRTRLEEEEEEQQPTNAKQQTTNQYKYTYSSTIRQRVKSRSLRLSFHHCDSCNELVPDRLIEVHHLDSDPSNNAIENLSIMCRKCHRKLSGRNSYKEKAQEILPKLTLKPFQLARRTGLPICEDCQQELTWDNFAFKFHRNRDCLDNNRENLGFVCHDCAE